MTDTRNRRILIVDDNPSIHDDFVSILAEQKRDDRLALEEAALFGEKAATVGAEGFEVISALQGQEALEIVTEAKKQGTRFALAFVDMRMPPGWDGVQTIEHLWTVDPDLQVVICTAYSDTSWEDILLKFHKTDQLLILKKPFDTAEVWQLARALTEKWHLARHAYLKLSQLTAMVEERTAELTLANELLKQSEERYALAASGANDGLWDWDIVKGQIYYAPRWGEMLGAKPISETMEAWFKLLHPDDRERVPAGIQTFIEGTEETYKIEYRILHADGQYRWMMARGRVLRDLQGKALRFTGSQTDITDRKLAEEQLRHASLHDPLTGLPNRALLIDRLEQCIKRANHDPSFRYATLFLDLDHFKSINDTMGHGAGDLLLMALGKRLQQNTYEFDSLNPDVSRLGGDEFVVILEGIRDESDAIHVSERILEALTTPFIINGKKILANTSIGIAIGHSRHQSADEILRDADTALYRAKSTGRGKFAFFDDETHCLLMAKWSLETGLRDGIGLGELCVHYQPIFDAHSEEIIEVEALVRWKNPNRGLLLPGEFIAMAEKTGLIHPLTEWVLRNSIRQYSLWQTEGIAPARLAINLSALSAINPTLCTDILKILNTYEVNPCCLRLELTETGVLEGGKTTFQLITDLRAANVSIALDDFGTGYSSLTHIHQLAIDALKVDGSFVSRLPDDRTSMSIIQAMVTFARSLSLQVIAEGVETQEQLNCVRDAGCNAVQGYLLSPPLDITPIGKLLSSKAKKTS